MCSEESQILGPSPWSPALLSDTPVFLEAPGGAKAAAAGRAAEQFESGVNQLVRLQVVLLTEPFATDATLKRLLATVDTLVTHQVLGHTKTLPTDLAHEWFLSTVCALMQFGARLRSKGFLTLNAAEGFPL